MAARVIGNLDCITSAGVASGWCWSPEQPDLQRSIALIAAGVQVGYTTCSVKRDSLALAGIGDGSHAFTAPILRENLPAPAGSVEVWLEDVATGSFIGSPIIFTFQSVGRSLPSENAGLRGFVDRVDQAGLVTGWCWNPREAKKRVDVTILLDGECVGHTIADSFRADLETAGIGDGAHGFTFLLPWRNIANRSVAQVSIAERSGTRPLHSIAFRPSAAAPLDERVRELEHQMRLLGARADDLRRQSRHDTEVVQRMLGTVGAFFTRLSTVPIETAATALVPSLSSLVEGVSAHLPALHLARATNPRITICVDASGTMESIYACLRSIHACEIDLEADILLVDDGTLDTAPLVGTLVQNLRYWRLRPGQSLVEARNRARQFFDLGLIAYVSPFTRFNKSWLEEVMTYFEHNPSCAVVGTRLVRNDGSIVQSTLAPDQSGRLADGLDADDDGVPAFDVTRQVAAVTDWAMVVQGPALEALGGFDPAFDARASAIDLCLRCWERGYSVVYLPTSRLEWEDDGPAAPFPADDPRLLDYFARRWTSEPRSEWTEFAGDVLVVDVAVSQLNAGADTINAAKALHRIGLKVTYACIDCEDHDPALNVLRRRGIRVLRAATNASVATAISSPSNVYDWIYITTEACAFIPLDDIRQHSPKSKLVLLINKSYDEFLAGKTGSFLNTLAAAVRASDATVVASQKLFDGLARVGKTDKVVLLPDTLSSPGRATRSGIMLVTTSADSMSRKTCQWIRQVVIPRIRRKLPGVRVHCLEREFTCLEDVERHPVDQVAPEILHSIRLAIAPHREATNFAQVAGCLWAGVPVVCAAPLPDMHLPVGLIPCSSTSRQVATHVYDLYVQDQEEEPFFKQGEGDELQIACLAKCYTQLAKRLGLTLRPFAGLKMCRRQNS